MLLGGNRRWRRLLRPQAAAVIVTNNRVLEGCRVSGNKGSGGEVVGRVTSNKDERVCRVSGNKDEAQCRVSGNKDGGAVSRFW